MNQAEIDKIIEVGEQQGFWIRFDSSLFGENEAGFEYGQDTPCGEGWFETISADNANDFMKELEKRINDWDSDSEAMPFIEMRGQQGVPSSIKDLVDDADWKYDRLVDFLSALQNTDFEEIESVKEESKVDETITKLEEDQESLTEYMEEIASVSPLHNLIIEDIKKGAADYENESAEQNIVDYCKAVIEDPNEINMSNLVEVYNTHTEDIYNYIDNEIFAGVDILQLMKDDDQLANVDIVMATDNAKVWIVEYIYKQIAFNVCDY